MKTRMSTEDEVSKSEDTKEQNDRDKELASFETLEVRFFGRVVIFLIQFYFSIRSPNLTTRAQ